MSILKWPIFLISAAFLLASCAVIPKGDFDLASVPTAPDYSQATAWAALPDRQDNADRTPNADFKDNQADAGVDVFFLHPTTYTGDRGQKDWNAAIEDAKLNKKTDDGSILYQASIFNGAGKVYAPRYRQAHINAYFTDDKKSAKAAFELAYADVKAAFEYYLQHYNKGRPFIIAGHSQGSTHGMRLIREMIEDTPLEKQLVVAYLVGMPVTLNYFKHIQPCRKADDTDCFCSWRTFKKDHFPKWKDGPDPVVVTNPLLWTTETTHAEKELNRGAVLFKFDKILPAVCGAEVHDGLLWVEKPKFKGSFLIRTSNYHAGDFNLFYVNVRNNAILRAETFRKK